MAYVSPTNKSTGTLITAAIWNQDVVANQQSSAPDVFTTKGDLLAASAADTGDRLAAGANGTMLRAESAQSLGLAWFIMLRRQGGDANTWTTAGTTNYTPDKWTVHVGSSAWSGAASATGTLAITYPVAFVYAAICLPISTDPGVNVGFSTVGNTGCTFSWATIDASTRTGVTIYWLAVGVTA